MESDKLVGRDSDALRRGAAQTTLNLESKATMVKPANRSRYVSLKTAYLILLASVIWVICGFVLSAVSGNYESRLGLKSMLGFATIFLVGTAVWAAAKGYNPLIGLILGWIGPIGCLILVILPNRSVNKQDMRPRSEVDVCLSCGKPIAPEASHCSACGWTWESEKSADG
jgi:hypothetical protein